MNPSFRPRLRRGRKLGGTLSVTILLFNSVHLCFANFFYSERFLELVIVRGLGHHNSPSFPQRLGYTNQARVNGVRVKTRFGQNVARKVGAPKSCRDQGGPRSRGQNWLGHLFGATSFGPTFWPSWVFTRAPFTRAPLASPRYLDKWDTRNKPGLEYLSSNARA